MVSASQPATVSEDAGHNDSRRDDGGGAPGQGELFGRPQAPVEPNFLRRDGAPGGAGGNGRWWAMAALLSASLAALIVVERWPRLAADADWRGRLIELCDRLGCALPPWREPSAIRIVSRDVRAHPSVPGALLIAAVVRNESRFAQPWPRLQLVLSDFNGRAVGGRRFGAAEYLGAPPERGEILAGQSASITLELLDPGRETVAFSMEFM